MDIEYLPYPQMFEHLAAQESSEIQSVDSQTNQWIKICEQQSSFPSKNA